MAKQKRRGWRRRPSPYLPWEHAFSMDALRRAWLPVRANKGRSGSDGETLAQFERHLEMNLRELRTELLQGQYRPQTVTQVLVPKPSGGWRPLTLWSVRDRVAQRAVYNYLGPVFERRFLPCSYGFRAGRSTKSAAEAIAAARAQGAAWVLDADIKDCFGQMRRGRIGRQMRRWGAPKPMRRLVDGWLRAKVWNAWRGEGEVGTSQGGVISPLLCNLYLHPLDQALQKPGLTLVRYADDFVVLSRHRGTAVAAKAWTAAALRRLGLRLHPQKTRITSFNKGFQFVGWFFVRDEMYRLK